ncbi:MAG TPA: hypothetical protein PKI66_07765 [Methanobacteriaceae archaeon]|nr:hypothetical protein [Methanobacteriaceae archaeon]HNS25314.1 hypothetical protein [Methanobacteriaceae archaeon]
MRVSEGVPRGRVVKVYHPELFQEEEEVIVFSRAEFSRIYTSIERQLDCIVKVDLHLDRSREWKLMGYWPRIMRSVHRIDQDMDLILRKEALQSYLDVYLHEPVESSQILPVTGREHIPTRETPHLLY